MLISELIEKINDSSSLKEAYKIIDDYMSKLDECDYDCMCDEIYELIYGEVLSKEKAEKLVKEMKPYGQVWAMSEVDSVLGGKWKLPTKYYVMNMMYNDYHEMFGDDTNKYIEISTLWLNDVDSEGGDIKTYRYATSV